MVWGLSSIWSAVKATTSAVGSFMGFKSAGSKVSDGLVKSSSKLSTSINKNTEKAIIKMESNIKPFKESSKEAVIAAQKAADAIKNISDNSDKAVEIFEESSKKAINQLIIANNNFVSCADYLYEKIEFYDKSIRLKFAQVESNLTVQINSKIDYINKEYKTIKNMYLLKNISSIVKNIGFVFMSLSVCYFYNQNIYNSCAYVTSLFFYSIYYVTINTLYIIGNLISWLIYLLIIVLAPILMLKIIITLGNKYYDYHSKLLMIINKSNNVQNDIIKSYKERNDELENINNNLAKIISILVNQKNLNDNSNIINELKKNKYYLKLKNNEKKDI